MAIGVARREARLSGERTLRVPPFSSLYGGLALIHLLPPALPFLLRPEAGPIHLLPDGWARCYWLGGNWVKDLTVQGSVPSHVCAAAARAAFLGLD